MALLIREDRLITQLFSAKAKKYFKFKDNFGIIELVISICTVKMKDDIPRPRLQDASPLSSSPPDDSNDSHHPLVDVLSHDDKWQDDLSFDYHAIINQCFAVTLQDVIRSKNPFELSVLLTNDIEIQRLNLEYRHKDKPTNVLSFNSGVSLHTPSTQPVPLGDIILSFETLLQESQEQGKTFQDHFTHMLIHGLLHLLGFDHQEDQGAKTMEDLEIQLLNKHFNIHNPYDSKEIK